MLIAILMAGLAWQEPARATDHWPLGDGWEWTYSIKGGGTMSVTAAAVEGRAGCWRLRTTGFRPDEAWPEEITQVVSAADEGIRLLDVAGRSGAGGLESGGGSRGEGHLLKLPLEKGATWSGTTAFYFSRRVGHSLRMSGATRFECLGSETIRHDGKDVECRVVRWRSPEVKAGREGDPTYPGCETTLWLAAGTGVLRGRMVLAWGDLRRDVEWTLTKFRRE